MPKKWVVSYVESSLPDGTIAAYRASRPCRQRRWWHKCLGL